jgi:hypothetical protein
LFLRPAVKRTAEWYRISCGNERKLSLRRLPELQTD